MSEIRVNNIIDEAGTGAPTLPNGATIQGNTTGTNLTLSGNLTVNGTTTTIDTAVTAVDSLAVDGNITALGNVGINTTSLVANSQLTIKGVDGVGAQLALQAFPGQDSRLNLGDTDDPDIGMITYANFDNSMRFTTNATERLRIDGNGTTKFKGPLTEKARYEAVTLNGDHNHDLITYGNVLWSDTAAAGAFTLNLRGSATVALNDMMDTGESLSFWFAHACHSTTSHYMTAFKVDGTTISGTDILWSGGSAPTEAGGGSGTKDVYTFTVFKTADATFRAFAAVTNHG